MYVQVYTSKPDLNKKRYLCHKLSEDAIALLVAANSLHDRSRDSLATLLVLVAGRQRAVVSLEDEVAVLRDYVASTILSDVAEAALAVHKLIAHLRALMCGE